MNNSSAAWQHGYYAADGYTYGYYREMTPTHLAWQPCCKARSCLCSGFVTSIWVVARVST